MTHDTPSDAQKTRGYGLSLWLRFTAFGFFYSLFASTLLDHVAMGKYLTDFFEASRSTIPWLSGLTGLVVLIRRIGVP